MNFEDIDTKIYKTLEYSWNETSGKWGPAGTRGSVDRYLNKYATGVDGGIDATGEYAPAGPSEFRIEPPAGETWMVARMLVYVEDAGSFDAGGYGNGGGLTSGILMGIYRGTGQQIDLLDGQPITLNTHWRRFCYDLDIATFGTGNESMAARWTFSKGGTYIRLNGDQNDAIVITCRDDLSSLVRQNFLFQGYKE